jgi:hypothetical protein
MTGTHVASKRFILDECPEFGRGVLEVMRWPIDIQRNAS